MKYKIILVILLYSTYAYNSTSGEVNPSENQDCEKIKITSASSLKKSLKCVVANVNKQQINFKWAKVIRNVFASKNEKCKDVFTTILTIDENNFVQSIICLAHSFNVTFENITNLIIECIFQSGDSSEYSSIVSGLLSSDPKDQNHSNENCSCVCKCNNTCPDIKVGNISNNCNFSQPLDRSYQQPQHVYNIYVPPSQGK